MPRLDQLSEIQRQSAVYFPCLENDTAPWVPWTKELSKSKVALVSSAGLHLRGDKPFVFTNLKAGQGVDRIIELIITEGMLEPKDIPAAKAVV